MWRLWTIKKYSKTSYPNVEKRNNEQKNTGLSTSYKQNVDNLFILWVLFVKYCELRKYRKKFEELLDFKGFFQYNRSDVLWTTLKF